MVPLNLRILSFELSDHAWDCVARKQMGTGLQTWSPGLLFSDVMPLPSRLSEEIHQGSPEPKGAGQTEGSTCRLVLGFCFVFYCLPNIESPEPHSAWCRDFRSPVSPKSIGEQQSKVQSSNSRLMVI